MYDGFGNLYQKMVIAGSVPTMSLNVDAAVVAGGCCGSFELPGRRDCVSGGPVSWILMVT